MDNYERDQVHHLLHNTLHAFNGLEGDYRCVLCGVDFCYTINTLDKWRAPKEYAGVRYKPLSKSPL